MVSARVYRKNPSAEYTYKQSLKDVEQYKEEIEKIEKKILEIINLSESLKENYDLIPSIKGIAFINTIAILIYTANFTRFSNPKQFMCYIGVVPFDHSSGTSLHKSKRISRLVNKIMKAYLTQPARCAVRQEKSLREYCLRKLTEGKNERLVINNVRNKLVQIIFAVVKNKTAYRREYQYGMLN